MTDCVFCPIVADESLADIVWRWDDALAFLPHPDKQGRRGCAVGHLLVIPKGHVADAAEDHEVTGLVAGRAPELATGVYGTNFHLITNCGPEADQTVPHLHWHIVPRHAGDGLAMPWTNQRREVTR
jgi:histidine triad (HIT) family protein